jgi:hypothetical protein
MPMNRLPRSFLSASLLLAVAAVALAACQSEPGSDSSPAASAPVSDADACAAWVGGVKALCTDFVEGRAVQADCAKHAIAVRMSYAQPEMQNPAIGPRICATHLKTLLADQSEQPLHPAVEFPDACTAFAGIVKASCIEPIDSAGEDGMMRCAGMFSVIGQARSGDDAAREMACGMANAMYQ